MRTVLLFGAGKSSSALIDYLVTNGPENEWTLVVADASLAAAKSKLKTSTRDTAVKLNIEDALQRKQLVAQADIVISLLPPALHYLVAQDCIEYKKNFLTASYIDDKLQKLQQEIKNNKLLFLCEMGLDPGIDHMSAKKNN